jgi:hypothetical protein
MAVREEATGDLSRAAGLATLAVLAAALALWASYTPVEDFAPAGVNPFMASLATTVDSRGQTRAHKAALVLVAVFALLGRAGAARVRFGERARRAIDLLLAISVSVGAALALSHYRAFDHDMATKTILRGHLLLASGAAALAYVAATHRRLAKVAAWASVLLLLSGLGVATVPSALARTDLSTFPGWYVAMIQLHFANVACPGDRLAAGLRLFDSVTPTYGLLLPTLVAGYERHVRELSLGDYFSLLRLLQALYLLAAAAIYWKHTRGKGRVVIVLMLPLLGWYHFAQSGLLTPNLTPWRLMGFPLVLLALEASKASEPRRAAALLGHVAAWALLLNVETGVSLVLGLLVYIWLRYVPRRPGGPKVLVLGACWIAGGGAALIAFLFLHRIAAGSWPDVLRIHQAFGYMVLWMRSGLGGLKIHFHPFAALLFAHSTYVLVEATLRSSGTRAPFRRAFRAAMATTVLVWLSYFVNRPWGDAGLQSYYLPYGILLADTLAPLTIARLGSGRVRARAALALALLAALVLPNTLAIGTLIEPDLAQGLAAIGKGPSEQGAELVSGVFVSARDARELKEKAAYLREAARRERLVYLTACSVFVPKLTGLPVALPFCDTFLVTDREYEALLLGIRSIDPEVVYFDAADSDLRGPGPQQEYYEVVKKDLSSRYGRAETVHGWEAWRRRRSGG